MAWICVDKDGDEHIFDEKPTRFDNCWDFILTSELDLVSINFVKLPKGSIKKLIGRELTWEDDCVELKEE